MPFKGVQDGELRLFHRRVGVGGGYRSLLGSSTGQGTTTRLPQLAQVASSKYQDISNSSKVARIEKILEPQGQECIGPSDRRSLPNLGGSLSGSFCLFLRRVGRRNIQTN